MFVQRKLGLFLSENVDDIKMTGKKQKKGTMWEKLMKNVGQIHTWKKLMKHVYFDEPTSCLDYVYSGGTQRECKPNEIIIEQYRENV